MIPQLRFPQFTDEWQKVKLSDVAKKGEYGMNAAAKSFDGINKYLRITDIDDETRKMLTSNITSPSGVLEDKYLLKQGDITIARTGASTGKSYIYNSEDAKVYFAGFLIRFRVNDASPYFVYLQTLRKSYDKWIAAVSARSGQPGVNAEEYGTYSFYLPSHPEQEKIAEFLTAVDEQIEKIEKKLELLQRYKKGVMQKIFTQQVRFKDENGNPYPDWDEHRAGELFKNVSNRQHNGDLPVLSVTQNEGVVRRDSLERKIDQSDAGINSYKVIEPDDFVISLRSFQGGIEKSDVLGISSPAYTVLRGTRQIVPEFFKHYFKREEFISRLNSTVIGIRDGKQISYEPFSTLRLPVPSTEEQQKIATFLTALDDKIKAEQIRLNSAKQWKKGLLQRMFV